jgi:hypothetical protein
VLREDVLPKHLRGIAVKLEHGGVELQEILGRHVSGCRGLGSDDFLEIGGHLGGARGRASADHKQRQQHAGAAHHDRDVPHEVLLMPS